MLTPKPLQILGIWEFTTSHVYADLKTVGIVVHIILHTTDATLPSCTVCDPFGKLLPHRKAWA